MCDEDVTIKEVYGTFKIRKKVLVPSIICEDKKDDDLLRWCLNRDLTWVLTNAVGEQFRNAQNAQKLEPLGSWTAFMKQVRQHETKKAVLKNLPAVTLPPSDNICK